jgi:hypothetical protein
MCHFTASDEVKSCMLPLSSPTANTRLMKTSVSTSLGGTAYDELIRRIRRRERNGSGSLGELEVCHCCPFDEVSVKRLPYLDLSPWFAFKAPYLHVKNRTTQPSYPEMQSRRLSRRLPKPHPKLSEYVTCPLRTVHILRLQVSEGPLVPVDLRNKKHGPDSSLRNRRQDLSRETVRTSWSSGLKAMRVTVRAWPSSG